MMIWKHKATSIPFMYVLSRIYRATALFLWNHFPHPCIEMRSKFCSYVSQLVSNKSFFQRTYVCGRHDFGNEYCKYWPLFIHNPQFEWFEMNTLITATSPHSTSNIQPISHYNDKSIMQNVLQLCINQWHIMSAMPNSRQVMNVFIQFTNRFGSKLLNSGIQNWKR